MSDNILSHLSVIGIYYLLAVNLAAFLVTAWDKLAAVRRWWRVPERTLFLLAGIGGAAGVWLAMQLFRHKIRQRRFVFGVPAIFLLQIALSAGLWFYFRG